MKKKLAPTITKSMVVALEHMVDTIRRLNEEFESENPDVEPSSENSYDELRYNLLSQLLKVRKVTS